MASLEAAELARAQGAETLRGLGAHALEIGRIGKEDPHNYGVIAYFSYKPKGSIPESIHVSVGKEKHVVPVQIKISEPFRPELHVE